MDPVDVKVGTRVSVAEGVEGAMEYAGLPGTVDEINAGDVYWVKLDNPYNTDDLIGRKWFHHNELIFGDEND